MSENFFKEIDEKVNEQLTINQILGHYLKKRDDIRGSYKYTCPFHGEGQEKTPSLVANDEKQIFKCFGCGEFGGIVSFIQKYNGYTYFETLTELREVFGTDIKTKFTKGDDKDYKKKKLIFDFHEEVNNEMIKALHKNKEHFVYLTKERQLTEKTIEKFKLGYSRARDIEEVIKKLVKTEKYKSIKLKDTGFFSNKDGNLYFLFTNRIMYPICNSRGNIVGWSGGRTSNEQNPKYINSVNNFIYNKSSILFNFDKTNLYSSDTLIICEGNLDSTQIYNFGGHNAVSLLGTNLTKEQIRLFKNNVTKVILALDQDEAGGKAAMKISKMLLAEGIIPYIVNLGNVKDIDDFLKSHREEYFGKADLFFQKHKVEVLKEFMIDNYILLIDKFSIERRYENLTIIKEMYSVITDDVLRNVYKYELNKNKIVFEKLEKEYKEIKKDQQKALLKKENIGKWDNNIILAYAIYLLKNNKLSDEELLARNIELGILVSGNIEYTEYEKKDFEYKYREYILEFEEISEDEGLKRIQDF